MMDQQAPDEQRRQIAYHVRPVVYQHARRQILRTGDIALSRPSSLEGLLISRETHASYTHAAMIGWAAADVLMLAETRQHANSRLISLSGEVALWPGYYDVYRVREGEWPRFDPDVAWSFMCHAAGSRYGWGHIARVWSRRHSFGLIPAIPNSDDPQWSRDCSALVHAALRASHGPQVKAFDCDVTPGDLSDPMYFDYICTLFADDKQIERHLERLEDAAEKAA